MGVLNAVGASCWKKQDRVRPNLFPGILLSEEGPLSLQDNPDVISIVDVRMNVLAGTKAPQVDPGTVGFGYGDFVRLLVGEYDLASAIEYEALHDSLPGVYGFVRFSGVAVHDILSY